MSGNDPAARPDQGNDVLPYEIRRLVEFEINAKYAIPPIEPSVVSDNHCRQSNCPTWPIEEPRGPTPNSQDGLLLVSLSAVLSESYALTIQAGIT